MIDLLAALFIVAHRGASADAPENTLPAFELAWQQNADAIEADFHLTKDHHIVCFHDSDTQKLTGKKLIIADSTLAQLQQLDVGSWKHPKFANTRIPTLDQVLATGPNNKAIYIEVKCGPEIIPFLKTTLTNSSLNPEQITIISFNEDFVHDWKKVSPASRTLLLSSFKKHNLFPRPPLKTLRKINADGLSTNAQSHLKPAFVKSLKSASFQYHTWTINDPKTAAKFLKLGSQSITTDRPGALRKELTKLLQ